MSLSIGIATSLPQPDMTRESLISSADGALYKAKHTGRNRFVLDSAAESVT